MFKALNDLSTPDFLELLQLNESLYGLRSNGPQKLCIPNINSVRSGKGSIQHFGPVIWNSITAKFRNTENLLFFKGNPNSQCILNWIIQMLHYYYRKQHKNIKNSQIIEQNLVISLCPSLFTVACASFAFLAEEFFSVL